MDCLDGLKEIPDKSINLIVTDPPYNICKAKWDKIPNYVEWCGKWFKECERVLKDNGSFYFWHNDMVQIAQLMEWIRKNTKFVFKQFIVWNKRFDGSNLKGYFDGYVCVDNLRNYKQMAEYCLFYTFQDETGLDKILPLCFNPYLNYMTDEKNAIGWDNNQFNKYLNYKSIASHWFWQDESYSKQPQPRFIGKNDYLKLQSTGYFRREYEDLRREYEDLRYTFNNQKTHHSVWNYEIAPRNGHATPKPLDMITNIIQHSSKEGDTILDMFMGSGTTAVACIDTRRNYIGFENDKTIYENAQNRIYQHTKQMPLLEG